MGPPRTEPPTFVERPDPIVEANPGRVPAPDATLSEVCADDGLLLSRYDINTVRRRLASICCVDGGWIADDPRCAAPWPAPDPVPCARWRELHADLLARYGHSFSDPKLQAHYATKPWYQQDDDFMPSDMAITAKRNVMTLDRFVRERIDCE